ncbi:unnamed protein product [Spirodela intermedia]|uniref:Retrovirus-related Pol polyprotein from transposon TNT 1-94-like beta-barrel domain-containing protein n=1 Tax=Spirodela intermedia TaxID=51605 RepID=A0A7I8KC68_SPIIN|nr:unnamed protein product [Spirodela intermedia]
MSIEQFQDLDAILVEEVHGTLMIHEDKLQDRLVKREEKVSLAHALGKNKKKDSSDSSQARGRGRGCGKGRARGMMKIEDFDDDKRPRDKSFVTSYNCQKKGHYANECRFPKKERPKVDKQKAIVAEENSSDNSLLMAFEDSDVLLQGISQSELMNDMWYLDMEATSHMSSEKTLFFELDESSKGGVHFGDDSHIPIEGRGKILLNTKSGSKITLINVLYTPRLRANILRLGSLDEQGCKMNL